MNNLIKFQLRNIFRSKFFYICLVLFIVQGPVLNYLAASLLKESGLTLTVIDSFTSTLYSEPSLVSIVFIVIFTCLEFNEGNTKNIISRGYSRKELLISKYVCSFIGLLVFYIATFITCLCLYIKDGMGGDSNTIILVVNYLFNIIMSVIVYCTLSFIVESLSISIVASLFGPSILGAILGYLGSYLKMNLSPYWFTNIVSRIEESPSISGLGTNILLYLLYIVLVIAIGIIITKKKEIK